MFKDFINNELRILDIAKSNQHLTEYGEGNLSALTNIKDWVLDNHTPKQNEDRIRHCIEILKGIEDVDNLADYLKGQLETYRYAYFKLLVEMGYLDSDLEEED